MRALHLTADLYRCRCDPRLLREPERLRAVCLQLLEAAAARPEGDLFHAAAGGGLAGCVLLAQGQIGVRTDPASRTAALDVVHALGTDGDAGPARALMDALIASLAPEWSEQRSLDRGEDT
ncbi:S-adenosylmethionine decarboxylase [Ramlibacter sp. AN1015]|uniref:S-adenosylmethionine decarboxylase family protein n=1 Tax=Ramlibacter sp. AN1015 TaxID=3133428 RepID=UPI0030BE797E